MRSLLAMIACAFMWFPSARAVVEAHYSMQKLAMMSDSVVLCEEQELGERVVEFPNGPVRSVLARCRPLRVLKGAIPPEGEFMVNYGYLRRPARTGHTVRDAAGHVTEEKPWEYFPLGNALLFLDVPDVTGERKVIGAKLIQNDEVYDMAEYPGLGVRWPQEMPENSPPRRMSPLWRGRADRRLPEGHGAAGRSRRPTAVHGFAA